MIMSEQCVTPGLVNTSTKPVGRRFRCPFWGSSEVLLAARPGQRIQVGRVAFMSAWVKAYKPHHQKSRTQVRLFFILLGKDFVRHLLDNPRAGIDRPPNCHRRLASLTFGMAKKIFVAPERSSLSRSQSETSTVAGKSPRPWFGEAAAGQATRAPNAAARPSSLLDTRVVDCGGPCRLGRKSSKNILRRSSRDITKQSQLKHSL